MIASCSAPSASGSEAAITPPGGDAFGVHPELVGVLDRGLLIEADGLGEIDEVTKRILSAWNCLPLSPLQREAARPTPVPPPWRRR